MGGGGVEDEHGVGAISARSQQLGVLARLNLNVLHHIALRLHAQLGDDDGTRGVIAEDDDVSDVAAVVGMEELG